MIRRATADDIEIIMQLSAMEVIELKKLNIILDREGILQQLTSNHAITFIAFNDNQPVGWVCAFFGKQFYNKTRSIVIDPIYVIKEMRGRIYGWQLLNAVHKSAKKFGKIDINLYSGAGIADEALDRLLIGYDYERFGFVYRCKLDGE